MRAKTYGNLERLQNEKDPTSTRNVPEMFYAPLLLFKKISLALL